MGKAIVVAVDAASFSLEGAADVPVLAVHVQ